MNATITSKIVLLAICILSLIGSAMPQQNNDAAPAAGMVTLGVTVDQIEFVAIGWRASKLLRASAACCLRGRRLPRTRLGCRCGRQCG